LQSDTLQPSIWPLSGARIMALGGIVLGRKMEAMTCKHRTIS
jgi:hypothetical protein